MPFSAIVMHLVIPVPAFLRQDSVRVSCTAVFPAVYLYDSRGQSRQLANNKLYYILHGIHIHRVTRLGGLG